MNLKIKAVLFTTLAIVAVGCGIKGPPLPPIETVQDKTYNGAAAPQEGASTGVPSKVESTDRTGVKKNK